MNDSTAPSLHEDVQKLLSGADTLEEATYLWEELNLHPAAAKSRNKDATREKPNDRPKDPYRTPFQHDRDRIIHSKAFRRLAHKTQIYIAPEGDHFRTRLSHTLEVAQLAKTAARALRLNEDLVEVIALGHDIGHPPFGHGGEEALQIALKEHNLTFDHHKQSYLIVTSLEVIDRFPLNLTRPARWGILRSSLGRRPQQDEPEETQEERLVKYVDDIAWVNHDIDDAIVADIFSQSDLGVSLLRAVGRDRRQRLNHMMSSLIESSRKSLENGGPVIVTSELERELSELKALIRKQIWNHPTVRQRTDAGKQCLLALFTYFQKHPEDLPKPTRARLEDGQELPDVLRDHISGMTDRYALRKYRQFHGPETPLALREPAKTPVHPCEGYRQVDSGVGKKVGDTVTLGFGSRQGATVGGEYRACYYGPYGTHPSRCDIEDIVGRVKITTASPDKCEAEVLSVVDPERPITKGCVVIRE